MNWSIDERIRAAHFDVTSVACPTDPEGFSLRDRSDLYTVKESLGATLRPAAVLVVGCGYGYGVAALLEGHPEAHVWVFGHPGENASLAWTRQLLAGRPRTVLGMIGEDAIPDDQVFDMIHLSSTSDGDATWSALEAWARRGRWVVLDGVLRPSHVQSHQAASAWIHRYAGDLDEVRLLPESDGHLVIRTSSRFRQRPAEEAINVGRRASTEIVSVYSTEYFLTDCGGYEDFRRFQGRRLTDPRLQTAAMIGSFKPAERILDVGCGRGELTNYFARLGAQVTAVDYSADAIELARGSLVSTPGMSERVRFICGDACSADLGQGHDLALAVDVVEHLMPKEVDLLYARIAGALAPDGVFVMHTYPNRWFYERHHPRRRAQAASVGCWLPPQPRSRYELVVHINEQDPPTVVRQLGAHFEHVVTWVGDIANPGGSLIEPWTLDRMEAAPDIFAVASQEPLDLDALVERLRTDAFELQVARAVHLTTDADPRRVRAGEEMFVALHVENRSDRVLAGGSPHPVNASYRWLSANGVALPVEGHRTRLIPPIRGRSTGDVDVRVFVPPHLDGPHTLRLTLVQEGVAWFDAKGCFVDVPLVVATHSERLAIAR